jgi:tryptophan-rich sensory protein
LAVRHREAIVQGAALGGFLVLSALVAAAGGAVTATSLESWYRALVKPSFNPPDRVFGPAWTILYALMAVAAWRVWRRKGDPGRRPALILYVVQLVLNLTWPLVFFGAQRIGPALAEILALWLVIAGTILAFRRVGRPAARLMVPYILWVTFAAVLNASIWLLNP